MKIARISVYQVDLPLKKPYFLSGGKLRFDRLDSTMVSIETDDGVTGWGEGCPWGVTYLPAFGRGIRAGLEELAPQLLGLDPRVPAAVNRVMDAALPGHPYIKSPVDIACWDILGQVCGLPLCDLLGGRYGGPVPIASSVSTGTPEEMVATIEDFRDAGLPAAFGQDRRIGPRSRCGPRAPHERASASGRNHLLRSQPVLDAGGRRSRS